MNCLEAQRAVLLAETGEIPDAGARELDEHLRACEACRTYRREIRAVEDAARNHGTPKKEPAPEVLSHIMAAAQERRRVGFRPVLVTMAMAASLAIVAGGVFMLAKPTPPPLGPGIADGRDANRVHHMRALVAMVSEDASLEENGSPAADQEAGLRALARQLLALEGLSMENGEEFELAPDELTSPAEPRPTALRGRSTSAYPPGRCG